MNDDERRKVARWIMELNEWRIPSEFTGVDTPLHTDGRDHIRVLYRVFTMLEKALKTKLFADATPKPSDSDPNPGT